MGDWNYMVFTETTRQRKQNQTSPVLKFLSASVQLK